MEKPNRHLKKRSCRLERVILGTILRAWILTCQFKLGGIFHHEAIFTWPPIGYFWCWSSCWFFVLHSWECVRLCFLASSSLVGKGRTAWVSIICDCWGSASFLWWASLPQVKYLPFLSSFRCIWHPKVWWHLRVDGAIDTETVVQGFFFPQWNYISLCINSRWVCGRLLGIQNLCI